MPGIGLAIAWPFISDVGYCSEYQKVYDAFTTKPSVSVADEQNTMVKKMVADGVWAKKDVFYVLAAHTNGNGEALINWINPGTYNATLVNTSTFVAFEGFTSNGSTSYIRTNFNCDSNGVNYTLNSASAGIYSRTAAGKNVYELGGIDATNAITVICRWGSTLTMYIRLNNAGQIGGSLTGYDGAGLFIASRTASNIIKGYRNKVTIIDDTTASAAIPNIEVYLLANNSNGSPTNWSDKQVSMGFIGGGFTQTDRDNEVDAFEAYMDSNGKGIIS